MRNLTENSGRCLKKTELSREKVELADGNMCDLVAYDVEDYGISEFAENVEVSNGDFRRARSMMPFKYLDADMGKFRWDIYGCDVSMERKKAESFMLGFHEFQKRGKWLYIYSKTRGSGKTFLSCALANEVLKRLDVCVKFVSVPELMKMTKEGYRDFARKEDLSIIRAAELLILDDIGAEMKKEWVDAELFQLIDFRSNNRMVTVFTSNVEMHDLRLDGRTVDRINESSVRLHIPEKPIRAIKAEKENLEFLQEILKTPH